jgi:hypothetical protein
MAQTVQSLNALMKYVTPDKFISLVPDNVKLMKMVGDINEAERLGRKFLAPVEAASEGGVTYGDGSAFTYNNTVEGSWPEAQVDCNPTVLNMDISRSAADRLANSKASFVSAMSLKMKTMHRELAQRWEIGAFYGKAGLGTIASTVVAGNATITFAAGQWAPGIWAGRKGHHLDAYNGATKVNTVADLVIASVSFANKTVTVSGNAADLAALAASHKLYFQGSYVNESAGLEYILTTAGTVFNLDNTAYELWAGTQYNVAGSISMSKILQAAGQAAAQGGLSDDCVVFINSTKWEVLNNDLAALRELDSSFSADKGENGVQGIVYNSQVGKLKIIGSPLIKEGDGFMFSLKNFKRVGVKDISFAGGASKEDYFIELPTQYGFRMQGSYENAIYLEKPAAAVKLFGIT